MSHMLHHWLELSSFIQLSISFSISFFLSFSPFPFPHPLPLIFFCLFFFYFLFAFISLVPNYLQVGFGAWVRHRRTMGSKLLFGCVFFAEISPQTTQIWAKPAVSTPTTLPWAALFPRPLLPVEFTQPHPSEVQAPKSPTNLNNLNYMIFYDFLQGFISILVQDISL